MKNIRGLLAATDLSAPARHAAIRAAMLAREMRVTLDLLHVVTTGSVDKLRKLVDELPVELEQCLLGSAQDEMHQLAEMIMSCQGIQPEAHVVLGALLLTLSDWAEHEAVDLIVLGARGEGFLRHLLVGSTAEKMLRKALKPLLVVKQAPHEPYRRLLVLVDFSPYSLRAIQTARLIAPDAHVVLLHVFDVPFKGKLQYAGVDAAAISYYQSAARREAVDNLNRLIQEAVLPVAQTTSLVLDGDVSLRVLEQERMQDCDLIVVGKHGDSMVEELLLGSITRQVLTESQADVLVSV